MFSFTSDDFNFNVGVYLISDLFYKYVNDIICIIFLTAFNNIRFIYFLWGAFNKGVLLGDNKILKSYLLFIKYCI